MLTETFSKELTKKFSSDARSKAIGKQWIECIVREIKKDEPYSLYIFDPNQLPKEIRELVDFTAYWKYDNGKHKIYISTGYEKFQKLFDIKSVDLAEKTLSRDYLLHEIGHSLYTDIDMGAVSKKLQEEKVPFDLVNLLEDGRIEYLLEKNFLSHGKVTFPEYIDIPEEVERVTADPYLLLYAITKTHDQAIINSPLKKEIRAYYYEALEAQSTLEVADIAIRFYNKYMKKPKMDEHKRQHVDKEQSQNIDGERLPYEEDEDEEEEKLQRKRQEKKQEGDEKEGGYNPSPFSPEIGDFGRENIEKDILDAIEKIADSVEAELPKIDSQKASGPYIPKIVKSSTRLEKLEIKTESFIPKEAPASFDPGQIDSESIRKWVPKLLQKFIKIKTQGTNSQTNRQNPKVLHLAGIESIPKKIFLKKSKEVLHKKNIDVFVDCSGSMDGKPMYFARTIVAIFALLAKHGAVRGNVIFSRSKKKEEKKEDLHEIVPLEALGANEPLQRLSVLSAGGNDGFASSIASIKKSRADFTFFLTDANIDDDAKAMRKSIAQVGLKNFTGVYVGRKEHTLSTGSFFDQYIVDPNIDVVLQCISDIIDPTQNIKTSLQNFTRATKKEMKNRF